MRMKLAAVAIATALLSTSANAGVLLLNDGNVTTYGFPAFANSGNSVFFNFNVEDPSAAASYMGFTRTGGTLLTGNSASGAEPESFGVAGTQYLSTLGNATTSISTTTRGFDTVSFFLGSIDAFNTVSVLSTTGSVIASFVGSQLSFTPNGNQELPQTNRRVTFTRQASDASIGGIRFASGANSLEVENLVFTVPEPSTWALMGLGFGMIGFSMRARRRKTSVVYS